MKISLAAAAVMLTIGLSGCVTMNQPPGVIVSEDFKSTAAGAIPAGFTKTGDIGVEEGVAHSGTHALKIEPAVRGGRFISLDPGRVAALGGEHWGRLYYKVKTPTPMPTGRLIHATFVDGKGTSPLANDLIDVRLATLLFYPSGDFKYFYNVQPPNGRKEFGPQSATMQKFTDEWTLLEWHVDAELGRVRSSSTGRKSPTSASTKARATMRASKFPLHFRHCRSVSQIISPPRAKALRSGSMTSPSESNGSARGMGRASKPV